MNTVFRFRDLDKATTTIRVVPVLLFGYLYYNHTIKGLERHGIKIFTAEDDNGVVYATYNSDIKEVYSMMKYYDWKLNIYWGCDYNDKIVEHYQYLLNHFTIGEVENKVLETLDYIIDMEQMNYED